MRRPASEFRPFAPRARRTIVAILLTFALVLVGNWRADVGVPTASRESASAQA